MAFFGTHDIMIIILIVLISIAEEMRRKPYPQRIHIIRNFSCVQYNSTYWSSHPGATLSSYTNVSMSLILTMNKNIDTTVYVYTIYIPSLCTFCNKFDIIMIKNTCTQYNDEILCIVIPHWMKIFTEFNLTTRLRLVKFTE